MFKYKIKKRKKKKEKKEEAIQTVDVALTIILDYWNL